MPLNSLLEANKLDALLLTSSANVSYLTGTQSRDSFLLETASRTYYLTDSRYTAEARKTLKASITVKQVKADHWKTVFGLCARLKVKRLGFEESALSYAGFRRLRQTLGKDIRLIPTSGLVERLRRIKTPPEIAKIRTATEIAVKAYRYIRPRLDPGKSEREIEGELQLFMRKEGATPAFDIIVASGPNGSYPHYLTGSRLLKRNEPVLIDMGASYFGYKSDLTRVFFLGKISSLAKKLYAIVLSAQERALRRLQQTRSAREADRAARAYITEKGYGRFFGHNLGHGVGRQVHEAPMLSPRSKDTLEPGMVLTVEPGIYLPGRCGIRIEDLVLITEKGIEVLSGSLHK